MRSLKFLYSQDLSNRKTGRGVCQGAGGFLYSQDLSNRKTSGNWSLTKVPVFVLSGFK